MNVFIVQLLVLGMLSIPNRKFFNEFKNSNIHFFFFYGTKV
jgi:hypothetical protein